MTDKDYILKLETVLSQILQPMKGIPFSVVVKSLSNQKIISIDMNDPDDTALIDDLKIVINDCLKSLKQNPIERPRPNEVGNDVELFVLNALNGNGLKAAGPRSKSGKGKSTGYPDILFFDRKNRPCYLECKIFNNNTKDSTMRTFYVSPSEDFKVSLDARHLLLSFEMVRTPIQGSNLSSFSPVAFHLVDLFKLECDMKHEFNADNKRLYSPDLILLSGKC